MEGSSFAIIKGKGNHKFITYNWPLRHRLGLEVWLYSSFNLGVDEDEWAAQRPGRFTPGKEPRYPFYRRLGKPGGRSGWVRKILPPPGFEPSSP